MKFRKENKVEKSVVENLLCYFIKVVFLLLDIYGEY